MNLGHIFGPSGSLAKELPGYELRFQQLEMARAIQAAFETPRHLIVEAGTGVGKSFAYLIPAIFFSVQTGEKVMVSTHTISLQEQLIHRDVPFLQKLLSFDFKVALAKGRSNYLSKRRLHGLFESERALFDTKEEVEALHRLNEWAFESHDGSLADLSPAPDPELWDRVKSESDNCLRYECPTYNECFYYKARRELQNANIIIANHHLLLSDLALRKISPTLGVLPSYEYLIIDEAHHLEGVATDHIGQTISNLSVKRLLDSLVHPTKEAGLFHRFNCSSGIQLVARVREEANQQFAQILQWVDKQGGMDEQTGAYTRRMNQPMEIPNRLEEPLRFVESELRQLISRVQEGDEAEEVNAHWRRCSALRESFAAMLQQSEVSHVYWVEVRRGRRYTITLYSAPVSVANDLHQFLFEQKASVIMTSATLSTGNSFDYFRKRIGLLHGAERIIGSPFDYESQVQIILPKAMPDPREPGFVPAAVKQIRKYVAQTNGRAFVLFTSYRMMDEVYEEVVPYFTELGLRTFRQGGELSRHEMLDEFRDDVSSVLFGTSSFWEGVDVRGESLSNVIIVKLPFAVPTHPVTEARMGEIEEQGGNSFSEYSLPEAILRFKQGFGRLIRSQSDHGIVVVLDPRVRTKFYGKLFLSSLPKCRVVLE